jgi:3-oxoacyl-[acyl-carrier protein] reductase
MRIEFEGQTVLVTGATRGIGKCLADDFAGLGANLLLTGTRADQIEALNRSAREAGEKKRYYCVDFLDRDSTERFLEALAEHDRIDVCINNAGINRIDYLHETRLEDLDDIVNVNLKAPFRIIRQISGVMKNNRYGRIVNISSVWGVISKEKRSIYSSTKFGIRGLTVAASNELARYNILVNSVSPGFVLTELTKQILSKEEMECFAGQVPVGRLASPEEISKVVLFFSSRLNTYVTGQNIVVDGGFVNV